MPSRATMRSAFSASRGSSPPGSDDPPALGGVWGDGADVRIAARVTAADHDREPALLGRVGDRAIDLIEGLLGVRADDGDVARVAEVQLLHEVDAHVGVVAVIERG